MNSSMRFESSAEISEISRNVGTCFSGITSRCVSAFGLMSLIATNPSALRTWSPSATSWQNRQSDDTDDALLRDLRRSSPDELPDRRRALDEPRRVVVAVAPARAIDEHRILRPELRPPTALARSLRCRAEPGAAVLLDRRRNRIVGRGLRPGPRRVREDVHLGDTGGLDEPKRVRERRLVLGREPDDDVGRQVETESGSSRRRYVCAE